MLRAAPELEAKALFEWLCERQPGKYQESQVWTLQRRVSEWRAMHQAQVASLEQVHRPGEVMQSDGVWLSELGVSVAGEAFKHVLIHSSLPYSNWEWGAVAQSESLLAYQRALQATLFKLGAVPVYHQTDNSSAVTHQVSPRAEGERAYNLAYLSLLKHYGLTARTIHVSRPEENGDIEASNGGLKQALRQHLLLRGSREFSTLAEYEQFLEQVMSRRNDRRQERLHEELAVMKPLDSRTVGTVSAIPGQSQPGQPDPGPEKCLRCPDQPDRSHGHGPSVRVASGGLFPAVPGRAGGSSGRPKPAAVELPPPD